MRVLVMKGHTASFIYFLFEGVVGGGGGCGRGFV